MDRPGMRSLRQAAQQLGYPSVKTLAYKNPVCEDCIAKEYGMERERLRARMEDFFGLRPCQGI